jgi:pyridoxal phosphate-dependent aminotransferase EpsN
MHLQSLYRDCDRFGGSVAEDLFDRGICLPSSSSLSIEDQLYVIDKVGAAATSSLARRAARTFDLSTSH